jgi:hypothetical protein
MSDPPKKPGYYWAKRESWAVWKVVEVFNGFADELRVSVFDSTLSRPLSRFTSGPEVTKPEGLK